MKLIHTLPLALAASLLPSAMADEPQARDYAITVKADVTPVTYQPISYPYAAGRNAVSGECTLTFDVHANGTVGDVQIQSCSSDLFRREAIKAASGVRFSASTGNLNDARMTIRWDIADNAPRLRTASLD
jgi:TonB family protein